MHDTNYKRQTRTQEWSNKLFIYPLFLVVHKDFLEGDHLFRIFSAPGLENLAISENCVRFWEWLQKETNKMADKRNNYPNVPWPILASFSYFETSWQYGNSSLVSLLMGMKDFLMLKWVFGKKRQPRFPTTLSFLNRQNEGQG